MHDNVNSMIEITKAQARDMLFNRKMKLESEILAKEINLQDIEEQEELN